MKKYICIAIFIISLNITAQDFPDSFKWKRSEVTLSYMPAVPLGSTSDFISRVSPVGVDFDVTKYIADDLSAGFTAGWTAFAQKVSGEVLEYNRLTLSGTQFRYINTIPLFVHLKKYFLEDELRPYVGFGFGTSWNEKATDIGSLQFTDRKWLFGISPEIGINYAYSRTSSVLLKVKYHYSFKAQDFQSISYLSFGVGLSLN